MLTCVDRSTRCILGFGVVWRRDGEAMQQVVDDAPPAKHYFSDGFPTYAQRLYPGTHTAAEGKSETYSIEGDNAEMRHYLARLGRRRAPEVQASISENAGSCLRFCCRLNLNTPKRCGFP